jgi:hypothetical protein
LSGSIRGHDRDTQSFKSSPHLPSAVPTWLMDYALGPGTSELSWDPGCSCSGQQVGTVLEPISKYPCFGSCRARPTHQRLRSGCGSVRRAHPTDFEIGSSLEYLQPIPNGTYLSAFDREYGIRATYGATVAGKTTGNAIHPRIPLRFIRATYWGCHGVGAK